MHFNRVVTVRKQVAKLSDSLATCFLTVTRIADRTVSQCRTRQSNGNGKAIAIPYVDLMLDYERIIWRNIKFC